jgi:lipopolysaccharide transport system permease protein
MSRHPATPASLLGGILRHRELLWELARRDFVGRYRGSFFGLAWSLFHPLLMLSVYTVVLSVAFKARWGSPDESRIFFAIMLFSGMIVHGFFSECLVRAPNLIVSQPNYVKKVVFPLEILPWVALVSAALHFLVSFGVLLLFCVFAGIEVRSGALLMPVILLPLVLLVFGLTCFIASLGVYLRDLGHAMAIASTVLLFLSPVLYPLDTLPEAFRELIRFNPITLPIVQLRHAMFGTPGLDWEAWAASLVVSLVVACLGYGWFQKSRRGFADVV